MIKMSEFKHLNPAFQHKQYMIRRKVFKLLGGAFHVYDERGNVVLFSKQKAFKLKEDIRIYSDESQNQELLTIKTSQIVDFSASYSVQDSTTKEVVGALKRRGLKSILKDEWTLLSNNGQEIGMLTETNMISAFLSRFINLIPQTYVVLENNSEVARITQHFNPFVLKYSMTISDVTSIDPRLMIAAGILVAAIEKRQD